MLLAPFQCDLCWFRNLKGRDPVGDGLADDELLMFIRRVNLDILWSRSVSTVQSTKGNILKGLRMCKELVIPPTYPSLGPWPVGDNIGFTVALQLLKASLLPGKYHETHQQFDTIRGLRTAFSNIFESSNSAQKARRVLRGDGGITLHSSTCPTQSDLFERFMKGLISRMGKDVRSNAGLSHTVLKSILLNLEKEINEEPSYSRQRFLLLCGVFIVVCYGGSLRGCEGFMMERSDLIRNISRGQYDTEIPHVVVPLLGRFKGELGERCHLVMMVNISNSGIEFRKWVTRAVELFKRENLNSVGPVMCDEDGNMLTSTAVDYEFKKQVTKVQDARPDLIEASINVFEMFGIFRSMRKGSESRATEEGVSDRVIDLINRWRKMEGNKRGSMAMRDYYLDMLMVKKRYLRYSLVQ